MFLNQRARELLRAYSIGLAAEYGQDTAERYFSLTDPKETDLRAALLESVDFLSMITVEDVDQLTGQVVNVATRAFSPGVKMAAVLSEKPASMAWNTNSRKPTPARR